MLVYFVIFIFQWVQAAVQSRLWNPGTYPEQLLSKFNDKPNTGIAISGGGSRSMTCALGQLRALLDLDLIKNVRYISSISGGSWASVGYLFHQLNITDAEFLGEITPPDNLTLENLQEELPNSYRNVMKKSFIPKILELDMVDHWNEVWLDFLQYWIFDFLNIKPGSLFTLDADSEADIKKRNPSLQDADFVHLREDKPYWLAGFILTGPEEFAPFANNLSHAVFLEGSPLYVGNPTSVVSNYESILGRQSGNFTLGGMVEPFIFGAKNPAFVEDDVSVSVEELPSTPFSLLNLTAASSFFLSGFTAKYLPSFVDLYVDMNYWSPYDHSLKETEFLLGDGGCLENNGLLGLIARGVTNIVMFTNSETSAATRDVWDPERGDPVIEKYFPDDLFTYFGYGEDAVDVQYYLGNQVFPKDNFIEYAHGIQDAMADGKGGVFSMNLTTIENKRWGIPAGVNIELTTFLLSRVFDPKF